MLTRVTNARQRGANRRQREIQAKVAFGTRTVAITPGVYLLIDDVVTTGATIKYASQALLNAGATEVWVAIVARQPLE